MFLIYSVVLSIEYINMYLGLQVKLLIVSGTKVA